MSDGNKTNPFDVVVYNMTNVDPDDREKINHQLNELYLRNTLDKNKPLESFLLLHVLPAEKDNISSVLTSNFKFEEVAPGSDSYKAIVESNSGEVNAIITDVEQVVPSKTPSSSTAMSAAPVAIAASTAQTKEDSITDILNQIKDTTDYAAKDNIRRIEFRRYSELSSSYKDIIEKLPLKYRDTIEKYVSVFDIDGIFNQPNVNLMEEFNRFDPNNPKDSLKKLYKSVNDKTEKVLESNGRYTKLYDDLKDKKYGFFALTKKSKARDVQKIIEDIKKAIQYPSVSKNETTNDNYDKNNMVSVLYNAQNDAKIYFSKFIIMLIIQSYTPSMEDLLVRLGVSSIYRTRIRDIYNDLLKDVAKRTDKSGFDRKSIEEVYEDTIATYNKLLQSMQLYIENLKNITGNLYNRYNILNSYILSEKFRQLSSSSVSLGGVSNKRGGSDDHSIQHIYEKYTPYLDRQYKPLITSRKKNKNGNNSAKKPHRRIQSRRK